MPTNQYVLYGLRLRDTVIPGCNNAGCPFSVTKKTILVTLVTAPSALLLPRCSSSRGRRKPFWEPRRRWDTRRESLTVLQSYRARLVRERAKPRPGHCRSRAAEGSGRKSTRAACRMCSSQHSPGHYPRSRHHCRFKNPLHCRILNRQWHTGSDGG